MPKKYTTSATNIRTLLASSLVAIVVCLGLNSSHAQDRFRVVWYNSPDITIGGRKINQNMEFDSRVRIQFTADTQAFRAINVRTHQQRAFTNQKNSNPRYANHVRGLYTKSVASPAQPLPEQSVVPLLDTLFLPIPLNARANHSIRWFVEFHHLGQRYQLPIIPNADRTLLILPRSIFEILPQCPFYFNVLEEDLTLGWTYPIYQSLYACPFSLSEQKPQ